MTSVVDLLMRISCHIMYHFAYCKKQNNKSMNVQCVLVTYASPKRTLICLYNVILTVDNWAQ